jgi:membrane carboxypeptidase/penicillin-binding protein
MCRVQIARLSIIALAFGLSACASGYLNTEDLGLQDDRDFAIDAESKIEDTDDSRKVVRVVADYRSALVRKDFGALRKMIDDEYYDNGATTSTTRDDYGKEQLVSEVFEMVAQHAEAIQYRVTVKDVRVNDDRATVDYEFRYAYQYRVGEELTWDAGVDVNRLEMSRKDGAWKIISGL